MTSNLRMSFLVGFALVGTLLAAGCSDAVDSITNKVDCHDVCDRYASCYDENYPVDTCTERCEMDASDSEAKENRLERCDSCQDDSSCASAVFNCSTECAGIVP